MPNFNFQHTLIEKIKANLDENRSLADEVSDLLQISKDGAYRRLRGQTVISFDEAVKLARYYRLSLSEVAGHEDNAAVFIRQPFIYSLDDYRAYMKQSLEQLNKIQKMKGHRMYYYAKDIPVFYLFSYKKLAAFKIYVWLKSLYGVERIEEENYNLNMIPDDLLELAYQQFEVYSRINTTEIWNDTTVHSVINQVEYYYEAGMFRDKEEALCICDEFHKVMKIIYKQALSGNKVHYANHELSTSAEYEMYFHEILIMDNHIFTELDDSRQAYFIPYAGVNYLSTTDPVLVKDMQAFTREQIKKSALISDVSEKDRNKFFIKIRNKIDALRKKIESTDPFL